MLTKLIPLDSLKRLMEEFSGKAFGYWLLAFGYWHLAFDQ